MKRLFIVSIASALVIGSARLIAQPFDITTFDPTATGPWSEPGRTTVMVPKVPNGSIVLDGEASLQEYGQFSGVTVTPGVNAWILDFPGDRVWDGEADSSFTYWLAHDDNNFYVAVNVKDDVNTSDDPNAAFWKDDAIEIVVDALNDRFDNNTDSSKDAYGGHSYINYKGRFSRWNDETGQIEGDTWSSAVLDWTYGATNDVYGVGKDVAGGWQLEVRFSKRFFEDPAAGNKLRNGYVMGFNIGLDDDDKHGTGTSGDMSRTEDLELQYFWANRQRREGLNADLIAGLSDEDKLTRNYQQALTLILNGDGRLSHGGSGEILFGYDSNATSTGDILFVTSNADSPVNADPGLIALLKGKGYAVTPFTADATTTPESLQAAAQGKKVVILSESIGSTTVVDPNGGATGVFSLKDTDVPIISFEAYMYDNADWTLRTEDGNNNFIDWGNSGRSEVDAIGLGDARDSIYIRNTTHPITSGLSGKVKVYGELYSFNFGIPSADADVLASLEADGSYPTLFVYEKGDKLVDGSVAPNKRIAFFLGQAASPTVNYSVDLSMLNETGKSLLFKTIDYAIGATVGPTPTLSVARAANGVVLTFAGGQLESADKVDGPWATEAGTSPLTLQASSARKFFRVKG